VEPYLSELKKRSDQRIASDQDFAYIHEEMGRYKKLQAEKSVSLNEEVRLKEKKESDDRAKARKKVLAARPEPPGKIYDLTLKLADEPGLPAPTVRTNTTASVVTNSTKGIQITKKSTKEPATTEKKDPGNSATNPEGDEEAGPDAAPVDSTLDETRRILVDYIQLLAKKSGVAAAKPGN
jgi:carboxyl-terminal processing protease